MARVVRLWQYGAPSGGGSVMNYRPVAGWGRLPEGWSYVEATSVAVDAAGDGNSRVHQSDPTGRHVHSWGAPGTDPGCFNVPPNLATDADGLVYVADRENHRVQVFDGKGQYLAQLSNLHRPCGLFAERRHGWLPYVGE